MSPKSNQNENDLIKEPAVAYGASTFSDTFNFDFPLQYVTDKNGVEAVQIPLLDWQSLLKNYRHVLQLLDFKTDLIQSFKEIDMIQRGEIEAPTFSELFDEASPGNSFPGHTLATRRPTP